MSRPSTRCHLRITLPVLALAALTIGGCRSKPDPVTYARPYPFDTHQDGCLDIQVFRATKTIELTNTSGEAFGPSTIWLNSRFCRPIDSFAVGQTLVLPLAEFRDRWQDPFRGGGFFALHTPDRLVLAQIETPGPDPEHPDVNSKFQGLVVVRIEND